jgi:uncharacterized protein (DUF305 family)
MTNNQNLGIIFIALLALISGFGAGYLASASAWPGVGAHVLSSGAPMDDSAAGGMRDVMHHMMAGLEGVQGDAFDRAFLSEMIVHHEGAVAMAKAALTNAEHVEIKQMAEAIISAQNAEIAQMRAWQRSWYNR